MSLLEPEIRLLLGDKVWEDAFSCLRSQQLGRPERPRDVRHYIELSLDKLYTGTTIRIRAEKKIPCAICAKGTRLCELCKGLGRLTFATPQRICQACCASGKIVAKCGKPNCKDGSIREEKFYTVKVPAGARNRQEIRLSGQGDSLMDRPDTVSDIICTICEKPHKDIRRCGHDLYAIKNISINDALCGCKFVFNHLAERKIVVKSKPGAVIKPGDMRLIKNEGMPISKSKKGDLIIIFNIVFPEKLLPSAAEQILSLLPSPKQPEISEDFEQFNLQRFDPKEQVYHVPYQPQAYQESPAKGINNQDKAQNAMPTCTTQ